MKTTSWLPLFVLVALLSACAPFPPMPPTPTGEPSVPFNEAAMQAGMRPGHAIVHGQAFAKTVGGDVKLAAGNEIGLLPVTLYVVECDQLISAGVRTSCGEKEAPYVRKVIADASGNFEFTNIAPGKYFVFTVITWGVPGPFGIRQTGGPVRGMADVVSDTDVITVHLR